MTKSTIIKKHNDHRKAMDKIAFLLITPLETFSPDEAFKEISSYLKKYDKILYTPLTNFIYAYRSTHTDNEETTILTNLDNLLDYIESNEYSRLYNSAPKGKKALYNDTCRAILKIWDHTSLALAQFSVMNRTDTNYNERIENYFSVQRAEVEREMQQKMLTMLSIFTALAFLLFGGISSLDNVFYVKDMPLLKVMISTLTWGLCFVNMITLFLYFTGKLTNTSFKSTDKIDATVFEKYPIVFWSNFTILILIISISWIYYLLSNDLLNWLVEAIKGNTVIIVTLITATIILAVIRIGMLLINKTNLRFSANHSEEKANQK